MRRASQYCFLERHIGFGPHLDFPFFDSEPKRDAANEQHPAFEGERTNECVMDGEARADNKHTSDKKISASSPECSSTGWPFWIFRLACFLRLHPFPPLRAFCFRPFSMSLTVHPYPLISSSSNISVAFSNWRLLYTA
jgi:hypothetical protein